MHVTTVLSELPTGLYILTTDGQLGVYDAQRQLHIDEPLSRAFGAHARAFLQAYRDGKLAGDHRVAILYNVHEPRAWGRLTFSLEDSTVRALYPSSGHVAAELTAFQQKSREKSAYRGMELLLDYRREGAPQVPVYCPVLFDPSATLAQRASAIGREPGEQERDNPVIDVLNIAATIPVAQRAAPAVVALIDKLRQGLIRKDQRRDSQWSLGTSDLPTNSLPNRSLPTSANTLATVARDITLPKVDVHRLHETERVETIERWLKHPPQLADVERLRFFAQFRGLGDAGLTQLGKDSLIYSAPAGTRLLERGIRDSWNLYLLDGALRLTPADGAALRVDGGTDKAANPIASLKPRKYQVDTLSPTSFLWMHDLMLAAAAGGTVRPNG